MKTLILYASQYGTTEKCAKLLAQKLGQGAEIQRLKAGENVPLDGYETVVVAGSVRAGQLLKEARSFAKNNEAALLQKRLGLMICCGTQAEADKHFETNFSPALLAHAAKCAPGGELLKDKMGFFARAITSAVEKAEKNGGPPPHIDEAAIDAFARELGQ